MTKTNFGPDFFTDVLDDYPAALPCRAEQMIIAKARDQVVVPCRHLEIEQFARLGMCKLQQSDNPRPVFSRRWGGEDCDRLLTSFEQVIWNVEWAGKSLQVAHLQWQTGCGEEQRDWVIAETTEIAEAFILEVERKTHAPGNAILVFSNGRWNRSESLYTATQSASFEDLVLADDLKKTIRDDFRSSWVQKSGIVAWRSHGGVGHCWLALPAMAKRTASELL